MKETGREIIYVIVLVGLSVLVSKAVWLLPLTIFVPIVLAYSVNTPLVYLAILAVYAELFSVTVPGLAGFVVLTPYLIRRVWRGQVDLSVALIGVIWLTTMIQTVTLFLPEIINMGSIGVMPWTIVGPIALTTTLTSFLTIIAVHYNRTW